MQLSLDFDVLLPGETIIKQPPTLTPVVLTCANGQPWEMPSYTGPHHCPACAADVERACQAFAAAVAAGRYDAEGYTPRERARQRRATGSR